MNFVTLAAKLADYKGIDVNTIKVKRTNAKRSGTTKTKKAVKK